MSEEKSAYRQIMKGTTIFGGVQVFNIIIQIIRSKFVAVLLGPFGMGITGLLYTTINLISNLTNFGLGVSAVKDISAAFNLGDQKRIEIIVNVTKRLVWITGLLGCFVTAFFSPWISQLTFGNKDYTFAFIWISLTLLFNQLSNGQLVVLQGLRKLKYLAKANLAGSFIGLFITVPFYYFWGIDGIVPVIIGTSLVSMVISWYFSGKTKIDSVQLSKEQIINEGKNMLFLGFMINLSIFFAVGASYIIRIFIRNLGNIEEVGLYSAGFTIINTYVSLIFNAMATDYYPRLSGVAHDNKLSRETINQQAEISILILAPILIVFLIFVKWVVILLYSRQFIGISDMLYWAALGMFFKASSWSIAFIFLAKGSSRLFFWNELIANILLIGLNTAGYYLGGLTGLGFSFMIYYFIYLIQVYIVSKIKFEFEFNRSYYWIFVWQFCLASASLIIIKYIHAPYGYFAGIITIALSGLYSFLELNKRLDFNELIKLKFKKQPFEN
jgi:O-antigen/teichoic acid export membrane protein